MPDYRLHRGDVLLGTLTGTGSDMPWWQGTFKPTDGFDAVRSLFDRERELLNADRMDEWSTVWDELGEGLWLEPLDGREPITEFLLHIEEDGRMATWRY